MATGACSNALIAFSPPSLSLKCRPSHRISLSRTSSPLASSCPSRGLLHLSSAFPIGLGPSTLPTQRSLQSRVVANVSPKGRGIEREEVFFDGGVHYGDLLVNLVFGLTLVWLPLTLAAVFRNLFLRYRFTNLRITIQSGLLGDDRKDFTYEVIKDVKVVPRFIGEWGDMAIELKGGTKVDVRCVPKFREIAAYINERAGKKVGDASLSSQDMPAKAKGFSEAGASLIKFLAVVTSRHFLQ